MARIRTIKPDFFRHEGLQDLAVEHGAHVMLVFAGLWGHCDRFGRFECRPRHLKLDILPFLDFDMADTIRALEGAGFIQTYEVGSKRYGFIPSFAEHQRFGGKEASEPAKYPEPPVKTEGSNGEASGKQSPPLEWSKGMENGIREREGKGEEVVEQAQPSPSNQNPEPEEPLGTNWQELTPTDPLSTKGWPKAVDLRIAARFWNQMAGEVGLPEVRALTGERSKHLAARLKDIGSLGEWFASVNAIKEQPFLTGRNDRNWRANFDWFVKPSNFSKVIENTYERSNANGRA